MQSLDFTYQPNGEGDTYRASWGGGSTIERALQNQLRRAQKVGLSVCARSLQATITGREQRGRNRFIGGSVQNRFWGGVLWSLEIKGFLQKIWHMPYGPQTYGIRTPCCGGTKQGRFVILRFPLFCSVWSPKLPRCWEKQHEKYHCPGKAQGK